MDKLKQYDELLKHLRDGRFPENLNRSGVDDVVREGLESGDDEERERALLCAYYLTKTDPDAENLFGEFIFRKEGGFGESGERSRGRLHWIRLKELMEKERYSKAEDILMRLKAEEQSLYVWERIFTVLNSYGSSYLFYPGLIVDCLEKEQPDYYQRFREDNEDYYRFSLGVTGNLKEKLPGLIEEYARGRFPGARIEGLVRISAEAGAPCPVSFPGIVSSDPVFEYRERIISLLGTYISNLPAGTESPDPEPLLLGERILKSLPEENLSLYEMFSLLLFRMNIMILDPCSRNPGDLIRDFIGFLTDPVVTDSLNSAMEHDIKISFLPSLMEWIQKKEADAEAVRETARLLSSGSPYFQNLGATCLLQAARSGYDLNSIRKVVKDAYECNPEISNGLTSGSDIAEEDLHFTVTALSHKVFYRSEEEQEEGFMNLGNLTAMLALCQPPGTALRLKLLLELMEEKGHPGIYMEAGVSEAEPVHPGISTSAAPSGMVWAGPMEFTELDECFDAWENLEPEDLRDVFAEKRADLDRRYRGKLALQQREQIRSVFEDIPHSPDSLTQVWLDMDNRDIPLFLPPGPEETFDDLAWYLPLAALAPENSCFNGIYFRFSTVLDYRERLGIPLSDLLKAIAVHELFHAFIENRVEILASGIPEYEPDDHSGESPSWCTLGEAGANKASLNWAEKNLPAESVQTLKRTLLKTMDNDKGTGLPGYGEHHLIIDNPESWVPRILAQGKGHPGPKDYHNARNMLLSDRSQGPMVRMNENLWPGYLTWMERSPLPWFIVF